MKIKKCLKKKNNWDIKNPWFHWKYIIALKNMVEENISQKFRLKNIDEINNYFLEEIEQNELMRRKHKKGLYNSKLYWALSYFSFNKTGCISISVFASLLGIPIEITSSAIGSTICAITPRIKKYKSIIKKKKRKHEKIVLLAKSKLNSIEFLISKGLIDSNISHDEFVLPHNA